MNDIDEPLLNEEIFENSNVYTKGNRNMGITVLVKLKKGMALGGNSGNITAAPMVTEWEHDFPAPQDHWTVGNDWKCHLYDSTGMEIGGNGRPYEIIEH